MSIRKASLFADIPQQLPTELCQSLLTKPTARIERIVSRGHITPEGEWYDQTQDEWVMVISGRAILSFADGESVSLDAGDYLLLPAHCKHRVTWTPDDLDTIWLAIYLD